MRVSDWLPFMTSINDLSSVSDSVKSEINEAIVRVAQSGWYILGKEVKSFEKQFADYIGVNYCVSVANGTDALGIALKALEIGAGHEVINAANAGFYSTSAILSVGAHPVFCDITPQTFVLDPGKLKNLISSKTKAVIVTHIYGQSADVEMIKKICSEAGVFLIEDCAQSHGAHINNRKTGSWGDLACFSFYPTKNLGAYGDGGAITTSDAALAEKIQKLRQYGWSEKYIIDLPHGQNSRLDEMQAAILSVKLKYLDADNAKRRKIAETYSKEIVHPRVLTRPQDFTGSYVAHLYVLQVKNRDSLRAHLQAGKIPCDIHYPLPDHRQKNIANQFQQAVLPVTENLAQQAITLPCFPEMKLSDQQEVIHAINTWVG